VQVEVLGQAGHGDLDVYRFDYVEYTAYFMS